MVLKNFILIIPVHAIEEFEVGQDLRGGFKWHGSMCCWQDRTSETQGNNHRQSGSGCLCGLVLQYDSRVYLNYAEREMCDYKT